MKAKTTDLRAVYSVLENHGGDPKRYGKVFQAKGSEGVLEASKADERSR